MRGWELVTHPAIAERCCGVLWGGRIGVCGGEVDVWNALEELWAGSE